MKKIYLILAILFINLAAEAQNWVGLLKNQVRRIELTANYGVNRSSHANPDWFIDNDSITREWRTLVEPRITNRYGFGISYRISDNFLISVGFNSEERGWFRDSLLFWENAHFSDPIYIRGELIHKFISSPIQLEYEKSIKKWIRVGVNLGLVVSNRRPLTDEKYNKPTKRFGVLAPEVNNDNPHPSFYPWRNYNVKIAYVPHEVVSQYNEYSVSIGGKIKIPFTKYLAVSLRGNYQLDLKNIGRNSDMIYSTYTRHEVFSGLVELSYNLGHFVSKN